MSPTRRAVKVGNEAPAPGLASKRSAGSGPRLFSRDQRDAQQRYDDIIDAAWRSHSRSLAAGEPFVNGTPIRTPFTKFSTFVHL